MNCRGNCPTLRCFHGVFKPLASFLLCVAFALAFSTALADLLTLRASSRCQPATVRRLCA